MERDEDKKALRRNTGILAGVILIILLLAFTSVYYKQNNRFSLQDHLDEALMSLEEETVTLREFGYYIYEVESFTQKQALDYNRQDPLDYWNTHFSAGNDSCFVSELARDTALDSCIGDLVYERMAKEAGKNLTAEQEKEAEDEAKEWTANLSAEQKQILGLDEQIVARILKRQKLASDYAFEYSATADLSGYSGEAAKLLSGGGEYFNDKLLSRYKTKRNEKLIRELKFGRITVNLQNTAP